MAAPIPLRCDFDAALLRKLARGSRDPDQTRRLLALAEIYDGGSRSDAARIGGVGLQIVRDWVLRFNAEGPDGLVNGKAPSAPSLLDDPQRQALRQAVEDGPVPAIHGVVRWRLIDPAQWLFDAFRVSISKQTLSRELRRMGFRKLSARPRHHAQDAEAAAAFLKSFPAGVEEIAAKQACGTPIEIWFQDEARVGQKNKITRRWAKRGTRPSAPRDQRTSSAYIFGAICPAEGKGAGLSSCRPATARPWPCISRRSQLLWRLERTPSSSSTRRDGMSRRSCRRPATSRSCLCPRNPRVEPSREHLAVHARQLAFEPRLQILRRHPRPLLLRMEQAHRYALENHVHRNKRMGISVLITETWYCIERWIVTIAIEFHGLAFGVGPTVGEIRRVGDLRRGA